MLRIYTLTSGALAPTAYPSDEAFLAEWRKSSFVKGDELEWRKRMAKVFSESTSVTLDSATPDVFCRSLVKAGVLEVNPIYADLD